MQAQQSQIQQRPNSSYDRDLLPRAQLEAFRQWLEAHGCDTRDGRPDGGQFFFVRTTKGWASIHKGRRDTVTTHVELRKVVQDFMRNPLARSVDLASQVTSTRQLFVAQGSATPANDASAASDLLPRSNAQAQAEIDALWRGAELHAEALDAQLAPAGIQVDRAAPGTDKTVTTLLQGNAIVGVTAGIGRHGLSEQIGWVPGNESAEMTLEKQERNRFLADKRRFLSAPEPVAAPAVIEQPQTEHQRYLTDLRDDMAMHAPLVQLENETLAAFCKRRWEYATVMIANRPNEYRG